MPRPSAFNSTHFSSRPSHQEKIYRELVKAYGSGDNFSDDWDSQFSARLYAFAMVLGRCLYEIERLGREHYPAKTQQNLTVLEREYGLAPAATDSVATRRAELTAAAWLPRGARRSNVEAVLTELFGEAFVQYVTVATADVQTSTATPASRGVYAKPGTQRSAFRIIGPITTLGAPVAVQATYVAGLKEAPSSGDRFIIDPSDLGRVEAAAVASASLAGETLTLTATFTQPHNAGAVIATGRHPHLTTSKRHNLFVMAADDARTNNTRRRLHRAAHKLLRGVSTWSITDGSGPFKVGVGRLGITTIGEVT
jgi:hypothetical protein